MRLRNLMSLVPSTTTNMRTDFNAAGWEEVVGGERAGWIELQTIARRPCGGNVSDFCGDLNNVRHVRDSWIQGLGNNGNLVAVRCGFPVGFAAVRWRRVFNGSDRTG